MDARVPYRPAYLEFLRAHSAKAWLVFVNFLNDREMGGPATPETWKVAYQVAMHVMGLKQDHRLSPYTIHVHPDVRTPKDRLGDIRRHVPVAQLDRAAVS